MCKFEKSELFILKEVKSGKLKGDIDIVVIITPAPFSFVMMILIDFHYPTGMT